VPPAEGSWRAAKVEADGGASRGGGGHGESQWGGALAEVDAVGGALAEVEAHGRALEERPAAAR
jgi:hypothetical protein